MKLINGETIEEMKKLEDKSIDMILCDLPYGTTACKWDAIIPFDKLWEQYNRIIKDNGAIVLFATNPFASRLITSNLKGYKHNWIWHKKSAGNPLIAKYQPLKTTEEILIFTAKGEKVNYYPIMLEGYKDRTKDNMSIVKTGVYSEGNKKFLKTNTNKKGTQRYPKHLLEYSNANNKDKVHPTQKPVELLEYLIKTYTKEGETVLDNTMGSGSTGVACVNTKRDFIGIELDKNYFEIAQQRIKEATNNDNL